jgi:hypothetical protein
MERRSFLQSLIGLAAGAIGISAEEYERVLFGAPTGFDEDLHQWSIPVGERDSLIAEGVIPDYGQIAFFFPAKDDKAFRLSHLVANGAMQPSSKPVEIAILRPPLADNRTAISFHYAPSGYMSWQSPMDFEPLFDAGLLIRFRGEPGQQVGAVLSGDWFELPPDD